MKVDDEDNSEYNIIVVSCSLWVLQLSASLAVTWLIADGRGPG